MPPLKPIAKSKYREKSLGKGGGISKSDLKSTEIAPIRKKSTGGANTFCSIGFISIDITSLIHLKQPLMLLSLSQ